MCLIGVLWRSHPRHALVLAANRDEFHARPSAPATFWADAPQVFGGRDLQGGGSWLAVSADGRLAAVTNVRRMVPPRPDAPSRGQLVADFVRGRDSAAAFAERLRPQGDLYSGFNLLLYDGRELRYVDNHPEFEQQPMPPGVHVVSNDQLDTPWPKSLRLREALTRWQAADQDSLEPLLGALADPAPAADAELPDTGVGRALERMLSPPFIVSEGYGTRCSTLVTLGPGGLRFLERRFGPDGAETGRTEQALPI